MSTTRPSAKNWAAVPGLTARGRADSNKNPNQRHGCRLSAGVQGQAGAGPDCRGTSEDTGGVAGEDGSRAYAVSRRPFKRLRMLLRAEQGALGGCEQRRAGFSRCWLLLWRQTINEGEAGDSSEVPRGQRRDGCGSNVCGGRHGERHYSLSPWKRVHPSLFCAPSQHASRPQFSPTVPLRSCGPGFRAHPPGPLTLTALDTSDPLPICGAKASRVSARVPFPAPQEPFTISGSLESAREVWMGLPDITLSARSRPASANYEYSSRTVRPNCGEKSQDTACLRGGRAAGKCLKRSLWGDGDGLYLD